MRQVTSAIRWTVCVFAALTIAWSAMGDCERLEVANDELWKIGDVGRERLVRDSRGIIMPAWSPRGDSVAYGRNGIYDLNTAPEVVVIDRVGNPLHGLSLPDESPVNAIMEVGWRDVESVWAVGHVNPSAAMYLEWDVASGKIRKEAAGSNFAISPDGRTLAHQSNVPHGAPPPFDGASIVIGEDVVWPRDGSYQRLVGSLVWSADSSRLAFIATRDDSADVVVVDVAGKELLRVGLAEVGRDGELTVLGWVDDSVVVGRPHGDAWSFTATGLRDKIDPAMVKMPRLAYERCASPLR